MRRFSLYLRGRYYYCQFWNPETKRYISGKSTRQTSRNAATATVADWLSNGLPESGQSVQELLALDTVVSFIRGQNVTPQDAEVIVDELKTRGLIASATVAAEDAVQFCTFLEEFWDYDRSPYVREKLAHNQSISRRTCYDRSLSIKNYWRPHFPSRLLNEVSRTDLRDFSLLIAERVSAQTVNHIMNTATIALRWAYSNDLIPANPADGLRKFTVHAKKRDILSSDEAYQLFRMDWEDERARIANLTAMTTGLRAGEIAALKLKHVGTSTLTVEHSWSDKDGLKSPKNGESRVVPLLPAIREHLRSIAAQNPHGASPDSFIFWSTRHNDRPIASKHFSAELQKTLVHMRLVSTGVNPDEATKQQYSDARKYWSTRNVVFHSWRHFFASHLSVRIDKQKAMMATGHKSSNIFDIYVAHDNQETLREVDSAVKNAFAKFVEQDERSLRVG